MTKCHLCVLSVHSAPHHTYTLVLVYTRLCCTKRLYLNAVVLAKVTTGYAWCLSACAVLTRYEKKTLYSLVLGCWTAGSY